jgi:hypothetical protein
MHHCPKCYYEYEYCVSVCPDCGVPLADGPVPTKGRAVSSSDDDDSDALLLFESQDFLKLRFLLDLLDQEGIPYATRKMMQFGVASEILTAGLSTASPAGAVTRVYVAAENYEQAKELLAELEGIALTGDEDIDLEDKS